ncbi:MAG: hypothetical protein ABSG80_03830 [Verrucomicrobiota bacterium]|jgi:hypothetical protein
MDEDSSDKLLNVPSIPVPKKNRAKKIAIDVVSIHVLLTLKLKENESLDLICYVGGKEFRPHSVGPFFGDHIYLESSGEDGTRTSMLAPIELVTFMYVVSPKKSDAPPREIGFKATWDADSKTV